MAPPVFVGGGALCLEMPLHVLEHLVAASAVGRYIFQAFIGHRMRLLHDMCVIICPFRVRAHD